MHRICNLFTVNFYFYLRKIIRVPREKKLRAVGASAPTAHVLPSPLIARVQRKKNQGDILIR